MAEEPKKRRKKVVGDATHRTGTLRAAVKPGVIVGKQSPKKVIQSFLESELARKLSHSAWGNALAASADKIRAAFELPAGEELYLFTQLPSSGAEAAGILLSASGFHLLDGKGGFANLSWDQFAGCAIAIKRGMLVIGQIGISSPDSQVLAELFQKIKAALS